MSVANRFLAGLTRAGYDSSALLGVAFSGGLDSTALLALSASALPLPKLVAIHVDHGTRSDSEADARHGGATADALGVAFVATRLAADSVASAAARHGPEGGLRAVRYEALARVCAERGVTQLAVAHQADDVLEGHLLALCRGSGLVGLGGPRWTTRRGAVTLLRPLLEIGRDALRAYLEAHFPALSWVDDPTNLDRRYARNRIRHGVLPVLREVAGGEPPLRRATRNLHDDRETLEALLARALADHGVDPGAEPLDVRPLFEAEPALPGRVIVEAVRRYVAHRGSGYPPTRAQVLRICEALAEPGRTRWVDLPGLRLRVAEYELATEIAPPAQPPAVALPVGAVTTHEGLAISLEVELTAGEGPAPADDAAEVAFDAGVLGDLTGLTLRGAREGDRFRPFGLNGSKRLFRWLAERGIARASRAFVPVVALGDRVIWVVGHRRGDVAPVTKSTSRRLELRVVEYLTTERMLAGD